MKFIIELILSFCFFPLFLFKCSRRKTKTNMMNMSYSHNVTSGNKKEIRDNNIELKNLFYFLMETVAVGELLDFKSEIFISYTITMIFNNISIIYSNTDFISI